MKLSCCVIPQLHVVFINCIKILFFINLRILTQDSNVLNAKTLERIQSWVSGAGFFSSHSVVIVSREPDYNKLNS